MGWVGQGATDIARSNWAPAKRVRRKKNTEREKYWKPQTPFFPYVFFSRRSAKRVIAVHVRHFLPSPNKYYHYNTQ